MLSFVLMSLAGARKLRRIAKTILSAEMLNFMNKDYKNKIWKNS